ncbi:MAG TPA: TadE/TadG family type IV pilus assembly protein, partial [Myxococcota bacterium]|nr:TadE/TadG family type IV pilus assembly protein [Myxococcota bacterium]
MRRGSISVEFAVTLPIVLLLLIGVLEWGRMLAREV